jgi:hypothetical protein
MVTPQAKLERMNYYLIGFGDGFQGAAGMAVLAAGTSA